MDKLIITQDEGVIEYCNSGIVPKLYQILHGGLTDNTSSLSGTIHVDSARSDYINYITNHAVSMQDGISKFHITADKHYMAFQDSYVENKLARMIGDGIGVPEEYVSSLYNYQVKSLFNQDTYIQSFNELSQFTQVTSLLDETFKGCTSLVSIDISNIQTLPKEAFRNCESLSNIIGINNITSAGEGCFLGCQNLTMDIELLNYSGGLPKSMFNWSGIKSIKCGSGVTSIAEYCFRSCRYLKKIDLSETTITALPEYFYFSGTQNASDVIIKLPSTLTSIVTDSFNSYDQVVLVLFSTTPPTAPATTEFNPGKVYVPDASVETYKSTSIWKWLSIYPMSQFATDYPNS